MHFFDRSSFPVRVFCDIDEWQVSLFIFLVYKKLSYLTLCTQLVLSAAVSSISVISIANINVIGSAFSLSLQLKSQASSLINMPKRTGRLASVSFVQGISCD